MFSCCIRSLRSPEAEDTSDNDFRWKKGEINRGYSKGDNCGPNPGDHPAIFYIDSAKNADTHTPSPFLAKRPPGGNLSDASHADMTMTSGTKLDPNSQLQRKSKLHNEKLPSFSALDRSKRPRIRREEAVLEGDNFGLAYEPLTFETFRSSSPPLAVIAPLANAQPYLHNTSASGRDAISHRLNKTEREREGKKTGTLQKPIMEEDEKGSGHCVQDSHPLPALTHQMSIASDGAVSFQCKGQVNGGFCADEDLPRLPQKAGVSASKPSEPELRKKAKRPTSLHLPNPSQHSRRLFVGSAATSPVESSYVESAVDSDTSPPSHRKSSARDEDSGMLRTAPFSSRPDNVPHLHTHGKLSTSGDQNSGAENNADIPDNTDVSNISEKQQTVLESIPEGVKKKIAPPKPKRKNPPSNVSTAASRDAISECLRSKGERGVTSSSPERGVTSSSPERHGDVGSRHGADGVFDMDNIVLMPPESFMDCSYAGLDSFDEVNGSLV